MKDTDMEALARWAESDEPTISANAVIHRGTAESRAEALDMLLDAAETDTEREALKSLGGRPRLDPEGGPSLTWRVRAPKSLDALLKAQAAAEGRKFPDVLRAAAEEYVANHSRKAS